MSTYFNKEWLRIENYEDWLAEGADTKSSKCKVCSSP